MNKILTITCISILILLTAAGCGRRTAFLNNRAVRHSRVLSTTEKKTTATPSAAPSNNETKSAASLKEAASTTETKPSAVKEKAPSNAEATNTKLQELNNLLEKMDKALKDMDDTTEVNETESIINNDI